MTITGIEPYRKGKFLIYLNDEAAFVLYSSEIKQYGLKVDTELTDEIYRSILDEIVIKRAKRRTLHILDRQDKTEKQLRMKLRENFYPEEAIDAAVAAAKKGNYLNDERYARQYISDKSRSKSRRLIEAELLGKGIHKEIISEAMEELGESIDSDHDLIEKIIYKKCPDPENMDFSMTQKLLRYLTGKGFDIYDIRSVMERLT